MMILSRWLILSLVVFLLSGLNPLILPEPAVAVVPDPSGVQVQDLLGRLPLQFVANQGQLDPRVEFYAQGREGGIFFTREGIFLSTAPKGQSFSSPGKAGQSRHGSGLVRLTPVGMRPGVKPAPLEALEGKVNYFRGNDPRKWRTGIPTYGAVLYQEAYPGIDLKFYGNGQQLEYDVIVKPGADLKRVRFRCEGVRGLKITPEGDLLVQLPAGRKLRHRKPVIYQEVDGRRVPREGKFRLCKGSSRDFSFTVAAYDPNLPLVIDPVLVYSTFLGGSGCDCGRSIAVDRSGNVYITGRTGSYDFPTLDPYQPLKAGSPTTTDIFVSKIKPSGREFVYSTYLGGTEDEDAFGIAADVNGYAYVTGYTYSTDYPRWNPVQNNKKGSPDAFVTKLAPDGKSLVYSTYLGGATATGPRQNIGKGIVADSQGCAYVTGSTTTSDFPLQAPTIQDTRKGTTSGFVTKFTADGLLGFSTYLGGSNADWCNSIALDSARNVYVTGVTSSVDFPVAPDNAFQKNLKGSKDAFVSRIKYDGSQLDYSTYLGGTQDDQGWGIAVGPDGQAYIGGGPSAGDFPTKNPIATTGSAFVTKMNNSGTDLVYSTYLDISGWARGIAVDGQGSALVAGIAISGSNSPVYVAKLTPPGTGLLYLTTMGTKCSGDQGIVGIATDPSGNAYVTGVTTTTDFPVKNALQPTAKGAVTAFVFKLRDYPVVISPVNLLLLGD